DVIYTIVNSDFHQLSKDGTSEIITLQIARLKDGVFYDLEKIDAFAIAKFFVAFYDQWQWWNKNYMKFRTDELRRGKMTLESLKRVQSKIILLPNPTKQSIGTNVATLLDLEEVEPFM
ncbi:MAG: hypothetical protein ACK559_17655, partial [bacterium]